MRLSVLCPHTLCCAVLVQELNEAALAYVAAAGLTKDAPNDRTLVLDAILCDALFKGVSVRTAYSVSPTIMYCIRQEPSVSWLSFLCEQSVPLSTEKHRHLLRLLRVSLSCLSKQDRAVGEGYSMCTHWALPCLRPGDQEG